MKVDLISKSGKRLQLHGAEIAVKPNGFNPIELRAELDEGESPVEIIITSGNGQRVSHPIRRLTVHSKEEVWVKPHTRRYKNTTVKVPGYHMRKPLGRPKNTMRKAA